MSNTKNQRFKALYNRYYRDVVDWLCRRGVDRELARDLTQDTFVRVYGGIEDFRGEAPWPWLKTIAKNTWANWLRQQATQKRGKAETAVDIVPEPKADNLAPWNPKPASPEETTHWNDRIARLNHTIDALPERTRTIFLLRYRDGLKNKEVAGMLRISIDTVKTHLRKAREAIAAAMPDYAPEGLSR